MAEGGAPLKADKEIFLDKEEIDSLHMLFVRDLIAYVIRRKAPDFNFRHQYAKVFPATPFSYRIRQAVDFYQNKQCIDFDTLFHLAFINEVMDHGGFMRVKKTAVRRVINNIETYNDSLQFLFMFAYFATLAYVRGVHTAPYFALFNMETFLRLYMSRKNLTPEAYYGELGFQAQYLMHKGRPTFAIF